MKNFIVILVALCAITTMALAQKSSVMAIPPHAQLSLYPIESGPLPIRKQADLNLRPMKLKEDWTGFNLYRKLRGDGRWVYETLPAGTIVLADSAGSPVYKATCGNRLAAMPPVPAPSEQSSGSWPQWFFNLLAVLILITLLAFITWLIYNLFENVRTRSATDDGGAEPHPVPQPPAPEHGGVNPPPGPTPDSGQPRQPTPTPNSERGSGKKFFAVYIDENSTKVNFDGFKRVTFRVTEDGEHSVSAS